MIRYQSIWTSCVELWVLVQRSAVWWPMAFVYIYSFCQISNPVWYNYLVESLGFDDWDLGIITIASAVASWIALYIYRECFFGTSWQAIYYVTTLVDVILSAGQLLLIYNLTWIFPKIVFATGDYAFISFSQYMQFMPMCILAVLVIPEGHEGASYALLTTWMNVAYEVGYDFGTLFTDWWDVSNSTLEAKEYSGLVKITILTTALQLAPICLVWMFPDNKAAVMKLLKEDTNSTVAGWIFMFVLIASILGSLAYSIDVIIYPGDDDSD